MKHDPAPGNLIHKLKEKFTFQKPSEQMTPLAYQLKLLQKKKLINKTEYLMMQGIINFQTKMAREVMVPRPDAFMVDINRDLQANLSAILQQPYSRIPVYDGDKDKIVGVIHIRTILRRARKIGFDKLHYDDLMLTPLFARETIELGELFVQMQQSQRQLAILTDEYGGVVGLVTIEDLIEEIVGDIDDEDDHVEVLARQISANTYLVDGKMPLTDFNLQFQTSLEEDDIDTIAGYMITKLGLIPAQNEKLRVPINDQMTLVTQRMKGSRLLTVLLQVRPEKRKQTGSHESEFN